MDTKKIMMKCGHRQIGETADGKPYCIICNCGEVMENLPDLTGRTAECCFCDNKEKSDFYLPFFEYRPNQEHDSYYCGCGGWD